MKRNFFIFIFASCFPLLVNAQIAKWLIEPLYDTIQLAEGANAIISDSAGIKILWSFEGKRLAQISAEISAFKEKRSVCFVPNTTSVACILKDNGEKVSIGNCNVMRSFPYFSCRKLLVQEDRFYRYVNLDGAMDDGFYINAYPFFNGYASCQAYKNIDKEKEPYYLLINNNGGHVQFQINGKYISEEDIEFISSVNDENIAVVVIKNKIYKFNVKEGLLSPVYAKDNETNPKNQAKLDGGFDKCYTRTGNKTFLTAKCGKKDRISFEFDYLLRPVSFSVNGDQIKKYISKVIKKSDIQSSLSVRELGNVQGIYSGNEEMLPPQFEKVLTCFEDKALVLLNGRYGMLEINKDAKFSIEIYKGKVIPFLHQTFETKIRIDMPSYILSDRTDLEIGSDCGLKLDMPSKYMKDTKSGNYIEYDCYLTIPADLFDSIREIQYPIQVLYNGLKSSLIYHKVKAYFVKKFEVIEDEGRSCVKNGILTFVFDVKNIAKDDEIVKTKVEVLSDTLLSVFLEDNPSETHYKYVINNLQEGLNNIIVRVTEPGCPPVSFPFEVVYHKPVPKTKTTEAAEETVVIKKKSKTQSKMQPRLDI